MKKIHKIECDLKPKGERVMPDIPYPTDGWGDRYRRMTEDVLSQQCIYIFTSAHFPPKTEPVKYQLPTYGESSVPLSVSENHEETVNNLI